MSGFEHNNGFNSGCGTPGCGTPRCNCQSQQNPQINCLLYKVSGIQAQIGCCGEESLCSLASSTNEIVSESHEKLVLIELELSHANEKLDRLELQVKEANLKLDFIDHKVDEINEKLVHIEVDIKEANLKLDRLEVQVHESNVKLDVIENEIRKLNLKLIIIEVQLASIIAKVDRLEREVRELNEKVDRIELKVDRIEEKVDRIELKVDESNIKLDKIQKEIDDINEYIKDNFKPVVVFAINQCKCDAGLRKITVISGNLPVESTFALIGNAYTNSPSGNDTYAERISLYKEIDEEGNEQAYANFHNDGVNVYQRQIWHFNELAQLRKTE